MVQLCPSVATPKTPKMGKSKTPKKSGAVDTPAKPEVKTPKQAKNTPAKAALQTPKVKKDALVKEEKSTPKVAAVQTPKMNKKDLVKEAKNTPKAAAQTPKNGTTSAKKNKAKTPKLQMPSDDVEMESEGEEEAPLAEPSPKKEAVINSEDAEMSSDEEEIKVKPKSGKSAPKKEENSKKAAGKRKLEDSHQSGGDQKRQKSEKITYENELFIARLNFSTSKDTVREHFSQFGEVVNVGLPLKPKKESNKGFAFVAFKEASAMKKAMAEPNQEIDSAKIVIEAKKSKKTVSKEAFPKPSHPNELFVGGLDNSTLKPILEEYFSKYGKVGNVALPWNQKDKRNKGYCFVSFESAGSLQSALDEDHEIDGKKVAVHAAGKKPEETRVVPKKAETKKMKAAFATAAVAEEDEDEEMEGDSDDEAEGEEGESDDEAEDEEGESEDESEGEEDDDDE